MRVGLFIDTHNLGGAEVVMLELAELLKLKSHEPVVMHFGNLYITQKCQALGIENIILTNELLYKKSMTLPVFCWNLSRQIRSLKLDVIHSHLTGAIICNALTSLLSGTPHIGTLHDIYMVEENPRLLWALKLSSWLGTRLIAVSNTTKQQYVVKGISPKKIKTVLNCVPHRQQRSKSKLTKLDLGIPSDHCVFSTVARLVPLKRTDLLIKAFSKAFEHNPNIHLLIIGNGPELAKLKDIASASLARKNILFLGERGDVDVLLQLSDVFCLVSDSEGLSRSILEAIANGLPIIATNVGGNVEIVTNNGLIIERGDTDGAMNAIKSLANSVEQRRNLAVKSKKLATTKLSSESFVLNHIATYQSIIEQRVAQ